ncbi:MAG: peptidylprolyl isomerase [Deltaproteobacteria bacterium]|nr:peptidylprolyl isomerase [Deltaproteobacteria bacterium]
MPSYLNQKKAASAWSLLILTLLLAACGGGTGASKTSVATVNGEEIRRGEFEQSLREELAPLAKGEAVLKREEKESLKEEVLARMIEERLMLQRAQTLGLKIGSTELDGRIGEIKKDYNDDGFKALFGKGGVSYPDWKEALRQRMLLEKVIAQDVNAAIGEVTDAEAERRFRENPKAYRFKSRLHALQIVVHEREQAEEILKRLKAGEEFGKVAKEVSIGPEGKRGGDLGFFERGVMPDAIDRIIFSLPVGKLSRVVESPYGFHVFKVLGKEEEGGRTFAEARERVIADLRKRKEDEAYERWLEGLKAKAVIKIHRPLPEPPALAESAPEKRAEDRKNE